MSRALASLLVAVLAAGCSGDLTLQQSVQSTTVTNAVSAVEVDLDAGGIDLRPRQDGVQAVWIQVRATWSKRPPVYTAITQGDTLVITGKCRHQRACATDVSVHLPPDLPTTLQTGAGDVQVADMVADTDVTTDAGKITINRVQGKMTLDDAAGDVLVQSSEGDIDAKAGAGTIEIRNGQSDTADLKNSAGAILVYGLRATKLTAHSDAGGVDLTVGGGFDLVDASSNAGAVSVTVPSGSYRLVLDTGSGAITVDGVTNDPHASSTIRGKSGTGPIQVVGR